LSRRSNHWRAHLTFALALVAVSGNVACWEQWSEDWFPQMKWQKAVQAFERVQHVNAAGEPQIDPFLPPEGAVPIGAEAPGLEQYDTAADALVNPTRPDPAQPASFHSLQRGKQLYAIYCNTCHGPAGMGDGPVSMANLQKPGPFAGVFPLVTATGRSDGYIYNLIRQGGTRMPSYKRIPAEDRWHIVNYVRHLQQGGQP
jgi:mono/diheme cytochrome c family protein